MPVMLLVHGMFALVPLKLRGPIPSRGLVLERGA